MASMSRPRKLVNPGKKRRRRNLSLKQLLHFGTKKQRAAAKTRLKRKRNTSVRKTIRKYTGIRIPNRKRRKRNARKVVVINPKRRRRNVGNIMYVLPGTMNPGRKRGKTNRKRSVNKGMARTHRRRRHVNRRRRANPIRRRRHTNRRRRRNVSYIKRVKTGRYLYSNPRRRRHSNPRRRHYARRRNPGIMSGTVGKILGVIGGAAVTSVLCNMVPAQLSSGVLGYVTTAVIATLQGKIIGKVTKSSALGSDFQTGGYVYLAYKILSDFVPSFKIPGIGLRGMGLIAPSSFYVPQVNQPGSMGSFVRPAMVPAAVVAPTNAGMGTVRRGGRVR